MKTRFYKPKNGKPCRHLRDVSGDCLERAGVIIPHGGRAIIDNSITPKVGDIVHCNNRIITINGFLKQIKESKGDAVIVGTAYIDESRDYTFEASEIYGVVTEVFCRFNGEQVYYRDAEKGGAE